MRRIDVYHQVSRERFYQDGKWGTIKDNPHTVGEWLLILCGELDEAIQAWQKSIGDDAALDEIKQVAAVAFACLEQHGCPSRYTQPKQGEEE